MITQYLKAATTRILNIALRLHRGSIVRQINEVARAATLAEVAVQNQLGVIQYEQDTLEFLADLSATADAEEAAVRSVAEAELRSLPLKYQNRVDPVAGIQPQVIDLRK